MIIFFHYPWRGRVMRQDVPFQGQRTSWPGWAGHGGRGGQWPPEQNAEQAAVQANRNHSRQVRCTRSFR